VVATDSTTATAAVDPGWEALARVASGDLEAFSLVVETHQERLLHLCERLLGDREEARDAAQEVFLKAFRKAGELRPQGQVFTWLYRIAVNHCLNKLRRHKIARFFRLESPALSPGGAGADDPAPAFDPPDPAPSPEAALAARRRWQAVRQAIAALPESQRAVLILVRFEGLSYRQAAEVLKITEGAVESRLVRALRRLHAAGPGPGDSAQETGPSRVARDGRG
jgi:RNA polymerase sigma-70 factor (ECF subfamily)